MSQLESTLRTVLNGLFERYKERVPDVSGIFDAMIKEQVINSESEIENDHIAFRTIGVKFLGIASLEKIFLHYGYRKMDYYHFPEKKLDAFWYAPSDSKDPRIFISELQVNDLSPETQHLIRNYTDEVIADPVDRLDLNDASMVVAFLHSGLWRIPTWKDYETLSASSEYAAWTIYNRYYLNHFTITVHNLKKEYSTIAAFNTFLEKNGFILNDASGKIKQSPDGGLLQSSTVAQLIKAEFADGDQHIIPGSYVEFAERKVLPEFNSLDSSQIKRQHRREGFEAANADKIFESTYSAQTKRIKE